MQRNTGSSIEEEVLIEVIKSYEASLSRLKRERDELLERLQDTRIHEHSILHLDGFESIESLKVTLSLLNEEERTMEQLVKDHRSLLPIRRVPPEIWVQIFIQCLPDAEYMSWTSDFPIFILGRVCSQWRNIVISAPQLWTSLSIQIIPKLNWRTKFWIFLSRSGQLPLSLSIQWYPSRFHHERDDDPFEQYLPELISSSSHRWRSLQLSVPEAAFLLLFRQPLPQLEELEICSRANLAPSVKAPNLRKVSFTSVYLDPISWNPSWPRLTEFYSRSSLRAHEVIQIFSNCPSIQRCHIRIWRNAPSGGVEPVLKVVKMAYLEHIELFVSPGDVNNMSLFDYIDAPALTTVELTSSSGIGAPPSHRPVLWPKPYLLRLIERSRCKMRKLVFKGTVSHDVESRDIAKRLVDLREIEIWNDGKDTVPEDIKDILKQRLRDDDELRSLEVRKVSQTQGKPETGIMNDSMDLCEENGLSSDRQTADNSPTSEVESDLAEDWDLV